MPAIKTIRSFKRAVSTKLTKHKNENMMNDFLFTNIDKS